MDTMTKGLQNQSTNYKGKLTSDENNPPIKSRGGRLIVMLYHVKATMYHATAILENEMLLF